MFVKIGRLVNLYFIIIIVIHQNVKKLNLHSKIANFNYKVQNCKCIKMKYLMY